MFSALYVFFFKQKTAYEMRISDWSSDVCSSDLEGHKVEALGHRSGTLQVLGVARRRERGQGAPVEGAGAGDHPHLPGVALDVVVAARDLQRALDRLGPGVAEERLVGERSEERRVGKECVRTCRSRWEP